MSDSTATAPTTDQPGQVPSDLGPGMDELPPDPREHAAAPPAPTPAPEPAVDPELAAERREEQNADSDAVFTPLPPTFELPGSDLEVRVKRIKLVEFMALMNVLNVGLGGGMHQVRLDTSSSEAAASDLAGLMLLAIPRATPEFIAFLTTITEPVDRTKRADVFTYWNSGDVDPGVMIDVFERLAVQEAPHVVALAGKVQAMVARLGKAFTGLRAKTATP